MLNNAQGKYHRVNNMKDLFSNLFQIRSLLSPHKKVKNSFHPAKRGDFNKEIKSKKCRGEKKMLKRECSWLMNYSDGTLW